MALSEFFESTVISVSVSFGFSGEGCDPDAITERLGLLPDNVYRAGDPVELPSGQVVRRPVTSWNISSHSESMDVNDHLRELLGRLTPASSRMLPGWGKPGFEVTWKGNYLYAGSGPSYEPDVLKGIASLGAALYQDIYQIDQDDEELEMRTKFKRIPKWF